MKRAISIGVLAAIFWPASAFGAVINIGASDVKPIALSNVAGRDRVVALANGSAEIVRALGLGGELVGRDIASSAPGLERVPIVTAGHQIVAEKVISLKPTLVLVDPASGPSSAIALIKKPGIKVVSISEAWKLEDISRKVNEVSSALGRSDLGAELNKKLSAVV